MSRRTTINILLVSSLVLNLGLIFVYFTNRPKAEVPMQPAGVKAGPKVLIDSQNFDFSDTKLSDEAWKLAPPDTSPPPAPDAPLIIEFK